MTRSERALQIWQVLLGLAHNRQTITYEKLAELIDMGNIAVSLIQPLGSLMNYCKTNDLPPLTILVVQKHTGIPGQGLTTVEELNKDREAVFNYEWYKLKPLTFSDLTE
jgi:hypothetical protein